MYYNYIAKKQQSIDNKSILLIILNYKCFILEHVWQVTIQEKGLGEQKNILGPYRLCLTDRTLSLVKIGAEDNSDSLEFPVSSLRRITFLTTIYMA